MTPTTRAALAHLHEQMDQQLSTVRAEISAVVDRLVELRRQELQLQATAVDLANDMEA